MPSAETLKGDHPYKMVIMSVDFVGSTGLTVRIGESKAERLFKDWQQHMFGILEIYQGHRISWGGDGGVLVFAGDDRIENALHAGIHALHYPLARYVRPLMHGEAAHIRVALHHGILTWHDDPETINSKEINLVCKLEKENCQQDALLVSEDYHRECGETLQKLFLPCGDARGGKLFYTSLAIASQAAGSPSQMREPRRLSESAPVPGPGKPHPGAVASEVKMGNSGIIGRDSSWIVSFELENKLPMDLAWIRLQADYFNDEEELIVSRFMDLGHKDSVKVILGAGQRAKWASNRKKGAPMPAGTKLWYSAYSEVYGKAKRVSLFAIDLQQTRKR